MTPPLLDARNLTRTYPGRPPVLDGLDLAVLPDTSVGILGVSGTGKSTLLNLLAGLDTPDDGTVRFDGTDLADLSENQLADLRAERIGFVFQRHHLLPQWTVLENVLAPVLARGRPAEQHRTRARELLADVGLADRQDAFPAKLSLGQRQRVALARALVHRPALLLADEPTGSLDENTAQQTAELLLNIRQASHAALVLVTHDPSLAQRTDHTLRLHGGTLE